MSDGGRDRRPPGKGPSTGSLGRGSTGSGVGKVTRVQMMERRWGARPVASIVQEGGHEVGAPVQRRATGITADAADVQAHAGAGVAGAGTALPHGEAIQSSFGAHDVSGVSAHVGGPAASASAAIGAEAYATGNDVAFAESPSLFVAAHEAAHVVQQRAGVSLLGGVGESGDHYEQQADAVAEKVVRGESAEALLGEPGEGGAGVGVQRQDRKADATAAVLEAEPASIYVSAQVGKTTNSQVKIRNLAIGPALVTGVSCSLDDVVLAMDGDAGPMRGATIDGMGEGTLRVRYTPLGAFGAHSKVVVATTLGALEIPIHVRGDAPAREAPVDPGGGQEESPTPPPEPKMPEPVAHVAQPLVARPDELAFTTVAGRPTLPQSFKVSNPNPGTVVASVQIEGDDAENPAFHVSAQQATFESEQANAPPLELEASYLAPTPGKATATIALVYGDRRTTIAVEGSAIDVPGTAAEDAERDPDQPVPVEQLPSGERPTTTQAARAQLQRAADALTTLPITFRSTVPAMDAARESSLQELLDAGAGLNAKLVQWVSDEGLHGIQQLTPDRDEKAAQFLLTTISLGTKLGGRAIFGSGVGTPAGMAASYVTDKVWDRVKVTKRGASELSSDLGAVGAIAGRATDEATRALVSRYAGLLSEYEVTRSGLEAAATEGMSDVLNEIRDGLGGALTMETALRTYARAEDRIQAFEHKQRDLAEALKQIAVACGGSTGRAESAFQSFLDDYLQYRATGQVGGGMGDQKGVLSIVGTVDLDQRQLSNGGGTAGSRWEEPFSFQLHHILFGDDYGYHDMSDTMRHLVSGKHLSDLSGWDVKLDLTVAHTKQKLALRQRADGSREESGALDADAEQVGGFVEIWRSLGKWPLGLSWSP